ncbi:uncharacterized protein LOC133171985 [Saccostrea echinata]|uniref:uncharacterized protein LOC133171985 n=1 Tax=Saccostrea echinata TaxID=191078 RepID=UPI002A802BB7|nr:uncharacterized protein LOC133171985 [Saccostrea echinata]
MTIKSLALLVCVFRAFGSNWLSIDHDQCYSSNAEFKTLIDKNRHQLIRYNEKIAELQNETASKINTEDVAMVQANAKRLEEIQNKAKNSLLSKRKKTSEQKEQLGKLSQQMESLTGNISRLERVMSARSVAQFKREERVKGLLNQIRAVRQNNTNLGLMILRESNLQTSAGFTIQTNSEMTLQDREMLVFPTILYRSEDGLDVSSSILTTTYSGVYLFHITVCSQGPGLIARAVVCKNYSHRWVGFAYAEDSNNSECGSNTVVVQVRKGDRFWVRSHKKSYFSSGSSFSASLVHRTE